MKKESCFFLILLIILITPVCSLSAVIEGIVLTENGPLEGSYVAAYNNFSDIKKDSPLFMSVAGGKKGFYRLELPPGNYYLTAAGRDGDQEYFSFHGANPITIQDNDLWLPFMVLPVKEPVFYDLSSERLKGKVLFRGEPVTGAQVSIYPVNDISFRGMGFFTNTTDDNGFFWMDPEPGKYVVIARKRKNFEGIRPLIKGDLFCYFPGNPVKVHESKETYLELQCYPKDDLAAFLDEGAYSSILVKKSGVNSVRFREQKLDSRTGSVSLSGRVRNIHGNPAPDLYVEAYKGKAENMFQMLYVRTMPEYMVKTDQEGYYSMEITDKGAFYLVARELTGDAPEKGEYYGLYEGNANHSVIIKDNPLKDIDIIVSKVMDETDTGKGEKVKEKGAETDHITNYHFKEDTVIDTDTVWDGEIIIDGLVHVARGATLTIAPGTTVKFRKVDRNHDGVGDGKIKVSGRLLAEGKPDKIISFTSAEPEPSKMDWSHLLLFASGDESVIRYCRFEDAFTGVQVHFSKVVISDSVFTNNKEGIRFGRTELDINHNDITGNSYGIRFTRLEGPVSIEYNNIRDNGVGIFHVPSNQSIVNFSRTYEKKDEFHRNQPVIKNNNISYNDNYNYRLGERQGYNMLLSKNWWGSAADENISKTIYDEKMDSSLGRVVFKPYLMSPANGAGVR